jgi:hypothetical protein
MTKQQTKTRVTNQTKYRNPETSPARDKDKPAREQKIDKPSKGYKQRQESFKNRTKRRQAQATSQKRNED